MFKIYINFNPAILLSMNLPYIYTHACIKCHMNNIVAGLVKCDDYNHINVHHKETS